MMDGSFNTFMYKIEVFNKISIIFEGPRRVDK